MIDFAVIDFSYPESNPENAYKVGLVVVCGGQIIQEFQSYIKLSNPLDESISMDIKNKCTFAPPFSLIERVIGDIVLNIPFVSCNPDVVKKIFELEHSKIGVPIPPSIKNIINPCEITGLSFDENCKMFGIEPLEQTNLIDKIFDCAFLYKVMLEEYLDIQKKELD